MKVGEIWITRKDFGPRMKVEITCLQQYHDDTRVTYSYLDSNTISDCFRWQFLSLFEKDWQNENR